MTKPKSVNGEINHPESTRRDDYLFRASLKAVILNKQGHVLVVKETDRDWWDIPGGGLDHGETIRDALARELHEEVSLEGNFEYKVILVEDPRYLNAHNLYQMRIIFAVKPENFAFEPGDDGDEVIFIDPKDFKDSKLVWERKIYEYAQIAANKQGLF